MEAKECWMRYAAGLTPAEFMRRYQSRDPQRCAERYVTRLPDMFGILRESTWRKTFARTAPPTREQIIGGLTAYLEETRSEWESALAEKTEGEEADWDLKERERVENEQAEWERAQQVRVEAILDTVADALPPEPANDPPPPQAVLSEQEEWERALNIRVEPVPAEPVPAEPIPAEAAPAEAAPETTPEPLTDPVTDEAHAEQTATPGTTS